MTALNAKLKKMALNAKHKKKITALNVICELAWPNKDPLNK